MPYPLLRLTSQLIGSIALARRRWYGSHPAARRTLERPVISIGNLSVGGTGKTPVAAAIARLLAEMGERPAILSRGYKRQRRSAGVLIVSDGRSVRTDVAHAGDEPFMLARGSTAAVLVSPERYLAGRIAETQLGCTVHILDDGFQHLKLARDIDLLIVSRADFDNPYLIPLGRLREPLSAAAVADAVLVSSAEPVTPADAATRLGVAQSFRIDRRIDLPRALPDAGSVGGEPTAAVGLPGPVFAMAGIANPQRFFDDLTTAGWQLTGTRTFADHYQYSDEDIADVVRAAKSSGAKAVLTTEKDLVRLNHLISPHPSVPILPVPLHATLDPAFAPWLRDRLARARENCLQRVRAPSKP